MNTIKIVLSVILSVFYFCCARGQTEYLISVTPATGSFTSTDSLPGVKWITTTPDFTTFDKNHHRYIFRGVDAFGNGYLYSVDVSTGTIVYNPSFPVLQDPSDNIVEVQYDNATNALYGLYWNNTERREYFIIINPVTGSFVTTDSLPGVKWVNTYPMYATISEPANRYTFLGGDAGGTLYLYSVDVNTGHIVSEPPFPVLSDTNDNIIELKYDNGSGILYGLHWDNSEGREYLVSVDPSTGNFVKIDSLPDVEWITTEPKFTTVDALSHRYLFRGGNNNGDSYLYSVDVINGNIVSNPPFPVLADPDDNVVELQFDNASGSLYALHWEANTITSVPRGNSDQHLFTPHPIPMTGSSKIALDKCYSEVMVIMYNASGEVVSREVQLNTSGISIQRNGLPPGVYFISLICDHKNIRSVKITIE